MHPNIFSLGSGVHQRSGRPATQRATWAKRGLVLGLSICAASSAMAVAVYGLIGNKYGALGNQNGPLGAALTDEANAPHGGRFNVFKNGYIYWRPDIGAFAVWGSIGAKWDQLGRVAYGYPITDETKTPDQRGRFNHFRAVHLPNKPESSIYWTPQTGAVAIYGVIRQKWAAEGWERGRMGYPTRDEVADGPFRRSSFERGFIRWSLAGGPEVFPTGLAAHGDGPGGPVVNGISVSSAPPGGGRVELHRDPALLSHADLCASFLNQPGLNEKFREVFWTRIASKLPSGIGLHSQTHHTLGKACEARAELSGRTVAIRIRVPGNRMFVRFTTPDGIPGTLDPNLIVHYDLDVRTTLALPDTVGGTVVQGPVTVAGTNVSRPETHSVTGNLLIAGNDVWAFLSGRDFIAAASRGGVAQISGVNAGSEQLNRTLGQLRRGAPAGARLELNAQDGLVAMVATR